jgi:hypothetical protein
MTLTTDVFAREITWQIGKDGIELCSGSGYQNRNVYVHQCCLELPGIYNLVCQDSYGDGWNGGYLTIQGKQVCSGRFRKKTQRISLDAPSAKSPAITPMMRPATTTTSFTSTTTMQAPTNYAATTSAISVVTQGTCEDIGLQRIYDQQECIDATVAQGYTITWGPYGGYADVVDGCSLRWGSQLFLQSLGVCVVGSSTPTWAIASGEATCECGEANQCLCKSEASTCPWTEGTTHKNGHVLCADGTYVTDWQCMKGGHGQRLKCPPDYPLMCAGTECGGGADHCCSKTLAHCSFSLRSCQVPTTQSLVNTSSTAALDTTTQIEAKPEPEVSMPSMTMQVTEPEPEVGTLYASMQVAEPEPEATTTVYV